MIKEEAAKILTLLLSFLLLSAPCQVLYVYGYQAAGSPATAEGSGGTEGA